MSDLGLDHLRNHAEIYFRTSYYFGRRVLRRLRPCNRRMRILYDAFRADAWSHAAERIGAGYKSLPNGVAEIARDGRRFMLRKNMPSVDDSMVVKRCGEKPEVHSLLARSGIPVPHHTIIRVGEFERALEMLRSSPGPLVVKPANGTGGGAGVSTNVTTAKQLRKAVAWARGYCSRLLIERQVPGECYRILVMDDEVLDTLVRKPPKIFCDGFSTVRQLIRSENKLRLAGGTARAQYLIQIDLDLRNTLASQNLMLSSRPAKGKAVVLKRVVNANASADNVSANRYLCAAILESALKAAKAVGARLAGVDVICDDPSVPLEESGGAVVEINTPPGFHCHYYAADADSRVLAADEILGRFFNAPKNCEAVPSASLAGC